MPDLSVSGDAGVESNVTLDSAVDSILAAPEPAVDVPASDPPPIPEPVVEPISDPTEPATGAGDPVKPEAEPEPLDPDDDSDLDKALDPANKANPLDLASTRGQKIYRSYKALKAVNEALGEDITPERATALRDAFVDKELMEFEFASGDPSRAKNFVEFWNNTSPQGMIKAAEVLPQTLFEKNPGAYMAMAVPVIGNYANALYQRAQAETNPETRASLLYAARMVDWDLNGKYRDDASLAQASQAPAPNPQAQLVDQRWNEIQRYEQAQQEQARSAWVTNLDETNSRMLDVEADKALAPLKAVHTSERLYQAARREFIEAVISQVAKDQSGEQLYQVRRSQAMAKMSSEDISVLSKQYEQRASRVIRALAPGFLKEAGVAAVRQSQARHEGLANAATAGVSPSGSGKPVAKSIVPPAGGFRSQADKFDAMTDEIFK